MYRNCIAPTNWLRHLVKRGAWALLILFVGCAQRSASSPTADAPAKYADSDPETKVIEVHWPNGQLKVQKHVLATDGEQIPHGKWTEWYMTGRKRWEGTYVRGQLDGTVREWHENGQLWTEANYENGKKHGPRYIWNADGAKTKEEHFRHGLPCGTWTTWKSSGKIRSQQTFTTGTPPAEDR